MYVCVLIYFSPDIESLAKHLDAVQVCDGSVHSILISHLNQCCARNTLHKLYLQAHGITQLFKSGLKQQLGAHMDSETDLAFVLPCVLPM